jgi:tRNA dimethylallyltransferase
MTTVHVICGPTAAGKSAVAMAFAEQVPVTIISADSRQIYRGFDIGSAKPTALEQAAVPHEGIDLADPGERWSAWRWAGHAREAIARARAAGRTPLIVGGTGFYIRALVDPLAEVPSFDPDRRARLNEWLEAQPEALLRTWCARLDPARADLGPVQLRRALEVALLAGIPLSRFHAAASALQPLDARYLLVDPGTVLAARIAARVDEMLDMGWTDEVRTLEDRVPADAPAWQATGYAEVLSYVQGRVSREDMVSQVIIRTRQYAKRQRTWFRHQLPASRVTAVSPFAPTLMDQVRSWIADQHEETV